MGRYVHRFFEIDWYLFVGNVIITLYYSKGKLHRVGGKAVSRPLKIFVTYSHKDTEAKDELITHLAVMKREGLIDIWHDNEIISGERWRDTISSNLTHSDILLYLVSASSLGSEICNMELVKSLSGNTRVIPIILEHCNWPNHQLSDFQVLPDEAKPINEWQPEDRGWENVLDGIRRVVDAMHIQTDPSSGILQENIQAEQIFQSGHTLMMLGRIDEAIEAYLETLKLNPHHAGAYANSIFVNLLRKKEQPFLDVTKPVVLTEGSLDTHYIQTALTLLGEVKLLNSLEIRPVSTKVNKGTHDGGKTGLDRIQKVYEANSWLFDQPILLLYDCDTNKQESKSERLWVRKVQRNPKNNKMKIGIENLFPERLFQDHFYSKNTKDDGGYLKLLDKNKFCHWICEQGSAADFEGFKVVVEILKEFVDTHQPPSIQQPSSE